MASESKKRKLKNSYCVKGALKNKNLKLKRILFYTSAERKDKSISNYLNSKVEQ